MNTITTSTHNELIKVLHGTSEIYTLGSDRVRNADDFVRKNAANLLDFNHEEVHPLRSQQIRNDALKYITAQRLERDLAERKAITDRWDARIAAGQNIIIG